MSDCLARQQIRDFVRMGRKFYPNMCIGDQNQCSLQSSAKEDAAGRLAIYNLILDETQYALPVVPELSVEMKQTRLRNAYNACLSSNEILKQLQCEAEHFTNITHIRDKQSGHLMYYNRDTGTKVTYEEYTERYSDYALENKVYYNVADGLVEDYIDSADEDEALDVSSSSGTSSIADNSSSSSISGGEDSSNDSPLILGDRYLRKRRSSSVSPSDEAHRLMKNQCDLHSEYELDTERKRSKSADCNTALPALSHIVLREKWNCNA